MKNPEQPDNRVKGPLRSLKPLVGKGIEPRRQALAFAVGALFGVMPLVWGTSLLCLGTALFLRLNPVAVQIANCAVYPLHLALVIPYIRLGKIFFQESGFPEGPVFDANRFGADPFGALQRLAEANGAALLAWGMTSPLLLIVLYALASFIVKRMESGSRRVDAGACREDFPQDPNQEG